MLSIPTHASIAALVPMYARQGLSRQEHKMHL